jgi:PTS system cellobiose-specific IIB component
MRILVVCGAGASSTDVALRRRKRAALSDVEFAATAAGLGELPALLNGPEPVGVVVVGSHLEKHLDSIRRDAVGIPVVLLPPEGIADQTGDVAYRAVEKALVAAGTPTGRHGS